MTQLELNMLNDRTCNSASRVDGAWRCSQQVGGAWRGSQVSGGAWRCSHMNSVVMSPVVAYKTFVGNVRMRFL